MAALVFHLSSSSASLWRAAAIQEAMGNDDPLPVPAQLETQLGKCKTVRPSTYYKSRERSKEVSSYPRFLVACRPCNVEATTACA